MFIVLNLCSLVFVIFFSAVMFERSCKVLDLGLIAGSKVEKTFKERKEKSVYITWLGNKGDVTVPFI